MLLLGGFLLIVSNSRGPLVAVGVALFALGALLPAGRATLLFATLLAGALGFAAISFYLELSHGYTTYSRIFEQSQIEEVNTQSRLDLYALALRSIAEAPLVGVGLEVPEQTGYPHNIVIEAALAVGLPGAMLFVLLILAAMYRAGRLVRADHESRWVFMLFVQQLVAVQFSASIAQAAQFWLLLGFMLALVHCRRQARKHSR